MEGGCAAAFHLRFSLFLTSPSPHGRNACVRLAAAACLVVRDDDGRIIHGSAVARNTLRVRQPKDLRFHLTRLRRAVTVVPTNQPAKGFALTSEFLPASLDSYKAVAFEAASSRLYQLNEPQALMQLLVARDLGIPPTAAFSNVHMVKGKPVLSAALMRAMVKRSGRYDYRIHDNKDKSERAIVTWYEKLPDGTKEEIGTTEFTMDMARAADLTKNPTWKKFAEDMLLARATSRGVRAHCPDVLMGNVYVEGELDDVDDRDTKPEKVVVATISKGESSHVAVTTPTGNVGTWHQRPEIQDTIDVTPRKAAPPQDVPGVLGVDFEDLGCNSDPEPGGESILHHLGLVADSLDEGGWPEWGAFTRRKIGACMGTDTPEENGVLLAKSLLRQLRGKPAYASVKTALHMVTDQD